MRYDDAVKAIKTAILYSQYEAVKSVNEKQLSLYYGIGKYISLNSRNGFWAKVQLMPLLSSLTRNSLD